MLSAELKAKTLIDTGRGGGKQIVLLTGTVTVTVIATETVTEIDEHQQPATGALSPGAIRLALLLLQAGAIVAQSRGKTVIEQTGGIAIMTENGHVMTAETRDAAAREVHWFAGVLGLDLGAERRRRIGLESETTGLETGTGTIGVGHGTVIGIGTGSEKEIAAEMVSGTDVHDETGARIPGGTHVAAKGAGAEAAGGAEVRGRTRTSRPGRRTSCLTAYSHQLWVY